MPYGLGIDLGTTQTAAAVLVDGRVEVARLGGRRAEIPSLVFVKPDGGLLIGEAAERRGQTEPARLAREFKRRIGDPVPILVGGTPFSAHALTAKLLRHVLDTVAQLQDGPAAAVTLTHPANWGPYKREQLDQAIKLADAGPVRLRTEPEAAALQHATARRIAPGETVAVYDLGGGTFDVAVLRRDGDGFVLLGEPEGVEQLGGIDFDEAVFGHVIGVLGSMADGLDPTDPETTAALARLRRDCVEAKESLSFDTETMIPVALPGLHTRVRLNRSELESMIAPSLADTITATQRALRGAGIAPAGLSAILLAGGSSRIPLVAQLLSTEFERPVITDPHPEHSIAMGAAVATAWLFGGGSPFSATVPPPLGAEAGRVGGGGYAAAGRPAGGGPSGGGAAGYGTAAGGPAGGGAAGYGTAAGGPAGGGAAGYGAAAAAGYAAANPGGTPASGNSPATAPGSGAGGGYSAAPAPGGAGYAPSPTPGGAGYSASPPPGGAGYAPSPTPGGAGYSASPPPGGAGYLASPSPGGAGNLPAPASGGGGYSPAASAGSAAGSGFSPTATPGGEAGGYSPAVTPQRGANAAGGGLAAGHAATVTPVSGGPAGAAVGGGPAGAAVGGGPAGAAVGGSAAGTMPVSGGPAGAAVGGFPAGTMPVSGGPAGTAPVSGGPAHGNAPGVGYSRGAASVPGATRLPGVNEQPLPSYGPPTGGDPFPPAAPAGGGGRRNIRVLVMVGALAVALLAGGTAVALAVTNGKKPGSSTLGASSGAPSSPVSASAAAPPPPMPTATMLVRVDTGGGSPPARQSKIYSFVPGAPARTLLAGTKVGDVLPKWSHDRQHIAVTHNVANGPSQVWIMDKDGGNRRQLLDNVGGGRVAWSIDDQKIAYVKAVDKIGQIFIIPVAGGTPRQLTHSTDPKDDPAWSADGKSIVYWVQHGGVKQIYEVNIANPEEPGRQITGPGVGPANDPAPSPDGTRILYTRELGDGNTSDIWIVNADGSDAHQVTSNPEREMDPTWSPDGTWFAFVRGDYTHPTVVAERPDGTGEITLTKPGAREGHPCWY